MEEITNFDTIWIAMTYDCNNRCKWCYASSNLSEYRDRALQKEKEDDILDLTKDLGVRNIRLIGGEPTMYEGIIRLTRKITEREMRPSIVTNGRKFSNYEFTKKMKDAGLAYAAFSIEGYSAKSHDFETCVKGSFSQTLDGLRTAKEVGIGTATNTTITRDNKDVLEKIVDLVGDDAELITFNICGPCLSTEENATNMISPRDGAIAFQRLWKYAYPKGFKLKLVTPTPICNFDYEILEEMKSAYALSGRCQMLPARNFVIDYNGDILPCTHFSGFPMMNIFEGDRIISKEKFLNIYNSEHGLGAKLRKRIRHFPSEKCTNTGCEELCTGGCPLFWTKLNPDEHINGMNK